MKGPDTNSISATAFRAFWIATGMVAHEAFSTHAALKSHRLLPAAGAGRVPSMNPGPRCPASAMAKLGAGR